MKSFKNRKKLNDDIFLRNIYRGRKNNKILEGKYMIGLFSRTRDSLHQREIQIIDEMLMNKLIDVDNYYLCDCIHNNDYKQFRRNNHILFNGRGHKDYYDLDIEKELGLENLHTFRVYMNEYIYCLLDKFTVFEYLKEFYNIQWNRDDECFYIEELNLVIAYENQRISDFIYRCLNKDINLAVISSYKENGEDKLAIRYIKPKEKFLEHIYPMYSLNYNKYQNNIWDVIDRFNSANSMIEYILIKKDIANLTNEEKLNIKSCNICSKLHRFYKPHLSYFNKDSGLSLASICTERDVCMLDMKEFNLYSNNIKCPSYTELTVSCDYCKQNNISYTKYYFGDTKFCCNECKTNYEKEEQEREIQRKLYEQKILEERKKIDKQVKILSDKLYEELKLEISQNNLTEDEIELNPPPPKF